MGQAGIEQSYDRYLKGKDGSDQLTVDSLGRPTSPIQADRAPAAGQHAPADDRHPPPAGGRARLCVPGSRPPAPRARPTPTAGAIVALDPHTGAVLALASNPTYQPSVYVSRDPAKLAPLQNEKVARSKNFPGLDRAIDGFYPPGSVWKPVTALAAMEEGILSPTESLQCTPDLQLLPAGLQELGPVREPADGARPRRSPSRATRTSTASAPTSTACRRAAARRSSSGPRASASALRPGIDIGPENSGLVPTPDWRCKAFGGPPCRGYVDRIWKPGYEVQLAIGQGDLEVTPIQMARFYAMIANGGQMVTPHIAQDVEQPSGDSGTPQVLRELATQQTTPSGVDPTYLQAVQEGLYAGTHSIYGTSYGVFGQFPVAIAGKTGTAEKDVNAARLPEPGEAEPVLVVRVRAVRQPVDRRLRRDRERRPRRHRRRAGGAQGLRAVLPQEGRHDLPPHRLMGTRMTIEAVDPRARGLRTPVASEVPSASIGVVARLDWVLLAATVATVAYGVWAIGGITRHDPGGSAAGRQLLYAAAGGVLLVAATLIDPAVYRRLWRAIYVGLCGVMALRARLRRGDARLEAVDRHRLLHLPAVRVREGAARARPRRPSSPTTRSRSTGLACR